MKVFYLFLVTCAALLLSGCISTELSDTTPEAVGDALVEGTEYHATGNLPCSIEGESATSCPFGVKREGNGSGIVTITKPDGRTRSIFFVNGNATGADVSEADPGEFSSAKEEGKTIVTVGKERYEIPDVVIYGD